MKMKDQSAELLMASIFLNLVLVACIFWFGICARRALLEEAAESAERAAKIQSDILKELESGDRARIEALKKTDDVTYFEREWVKRVENWPHDGKTATVPVQALRIGDMGFAAFPAEIFTSIGLDVKRYSPACSTWVVELANARASTYVPGPEQAVRGAYGAKPCLSRWLCAEAGQLLADSAQRLLQGLFE